MPFGAVTVRIILQVPLFNPFTDDPETRQYFADEPGTEPVSFDFAGTVIPETVANRRNDNDLPTFTEGNEGPALVTLGAPWLAARTVVGGEVDDVGGGRVTGTVVVVVVTGTSA